MENHVKEQLIVIPVTCTEPIIGRWLWLIEEARERLLRELSQVTPEMIDWLPPGCENSIGTLLYHIADIEADWVYVEVLESGLPPELADLFPYPTRDADNRLTHVPGISLDDHLKRLATVRGRLLDAYHPMSLAEFRRPRSLPQYDVSPEWVLHHLAQHEAEHRGHIGALRARAELQLSS